jgi:TRAP-type C4-dicarboxylate transport system substrate-binding protein
MDRLPCRKQGIEFIRPDDGTGGCTVTAARALTEGWGAAVVNLQMTDYYTAMERNTVDGISSSTLTNWVNSGCQAVTKYLAQPGYLQSSVFVMMNLNIWNKLPSDLQKVVSDAMIYSEKLNGDFGQKIGENRYKSLRRQR